jgi:hypothetical protein
MEGPDSESDVELVETSLVKDYLARRRNVFVLQMAGALFCCAVALTVAFLIIFNHWDTFARLPAAVVVLTGIILVGGVVLMVYATYHLTWGLNAEAKSLLSFMRKNPEDRVESSHAQSAD